MTGHIFISYSSKDREKAREVADALINEDLDPWIDTSNLDGARQWNKQIEQALETCTAVVVVWSKNSRNSDWVERETLYAFEHKKPVYPARIDDEPLALHLVNRQAIDLTKNFKQSTRKLAGWLRKEVKAQQTDDATPVVNKKPLPLEATEDNFLPYLDEVTGEKHSSATARAIIRWAKRHTDKQAYGGKVTPCLKFRVQLGEGAMTVFTLWAYKRGPAIRISFTDLMKHPVYRKRETRLSTLDSLNRLMDDEPFLPDRADRSVAIPLNKLFDTDKMKIFQRIVEEIIHDLQSV